MGEGRPLPWRPLSAVLVPFAGLAAGVGLQRWLEGPAPAGDALLRWVWISSGAGLLIGAGFGMALARRALARALWAAWGLLGPWAVTGLVAASVPAVLPIRELVAEQRRAACLADGRAICTAAGFEASCRAAAEADPVARAAALSRLGTPWQKICGGGGCTSRWTYEGPWGVDDHVVPGPQLCSVVADPAGRGVRFALLAGTELP